jgi:hypothetical protein
MYPWIRLRNEDPPEHSPETVEKVQLDKHYPAGTLSDGVFRSLIEYWVQSGVITTGLENRSRKQKKGKTPTPWTWTNRESNKHPENRKWIRWPPDITTERKEYEYQAWGRKTKKSLRCKRKDTQHPPIKKDITELEIPRTPNKKN